ncbi:MAG: leucyl/phenylalanyl-tRNA--protein transferase [Flavobacteriaceae bacterium]|nr:leucyl/phenylalanyl-tRNA--protein transferase [Flavobacteriaceae bacterium]
MYTLKGEFYFPDVSMANTDGLLAIGGDLDPERLKLAYSRGIFPWFEDDKVIMWWSPDPRMVLFPEEIKISKSMQKVLKSAQFRVTQNVAFEQVVSFCASVNRVDQEGTWITEGMKTAFASLYYQGLAKSFEVWREDELVGGLYGVQTGKVFSGESMFSLESNASKVALISLAQYAAANGISLIDCQLHTNHLQSMGAREIPRAEFISFL